MKKLAALLPISVAPAATTPRNKSKPCTVINTDCSRLTFLRLSFASLIIGLFWMVVQLHAYVVWWRSGEKASLLVAAIASCIALYANERMISNRPDKKNKITHADCIGRLSLITFFAIYLVIAEPSPISLLFPDYFIEVPEARGLKLEGVAVIFLIFSPIFGAVAGVRIEKIRRHLPMFIIFFCAFYLFGRSISFVYYSCKVDFFHMLLTCRGIGIGDIGGTTLNAIHAVQKEINPYTVDIQGEYNPTSAYRGYRYWPMMFGIYMPLASFFPTGWGAMRLTNFALDVITAALIGLLACRRRSGWLCGVLAASLYLMLPLLPMLLYQRVDTDLAPMVLLLAALALYQTRPGLAGVMVGLSVSAKFFPGLLMLVCCLPEFRRSRYIGGFALGLIPAIAFCLLAPSDFISNTVSGLLRTPFDPSSWLYGTPFYMISAARLAFILLMTTVSFVMILRPPDLFGRCVLYVICVVAMLLVGHVHNNYMLWWIPVFCILLSSPLSKILSLPGSMGDAASGATSLSYSEFSQATDARSREVGSAPALSSERGYERPRREAQPTVESVR